MISEKKAEKFYLNLSSTNAVCSFYSSLGWALISTSINMFLCSECAFELNKEETWYFSTATEACIDRAISPLII